MYHVIQSDSTIKWHYGSLWDWKYFHVVVNHVIENHVKQGTTVLHWISSGVLMEHLIKKKIFKDIL